MDDPFPFDYIGGGHYRRKGVPKGETADTLHGEQVADYVRELVRYVIAAHTETVWLHEFLSLSNEDLLNRVRKLTTLKTPPQESKEG